MSRYKKADKVVTPDPQLAAWCEALAPRVEPDTVPPGWMTAIELGKLLGKDRSTVTGLLQTAIREGRAEVKKFRVLSGQRGIYPTPHYRLIK